MQSSLPSERLEGATLHKENADHLEGSLGQLLDLGCTAVINTASEQLKDGMESKAKLMDALAGIAFHLYLIYIDVHKLT